MKRFVIPLAVLSLALPLAAFSADEFDMQAAEKTFETKCSRCHAVSRPRGKQKDRAGWETTVRRMQGKASGWISDSEAETIIEYLARTQGSG